MREKKFKGYITIKVNKKIYLILKIKEKNGLKI